MNAIVICICVWITIFKTDAIVFDMDLSKWTFAGGASRDTFRVVSIRSGNPGQITSAASPPKFVANMQHMVQMKVGFRWSAGYPAMQCLTGTTAKLILEENTWGNNYVLIRSFDLCDKQAHGCPATFEDPHYWWAGEGHNEADDGTADVYSPTRFIDYPMNFLWHAGDSIRVRFEFTNNQRNVHFLQEGLYAELVSHDAAKAVLPIIDFGQDKGAETTWQSWQVIQYVMYLVIALLLVNMICFGVNCFKKKNNQYKVVSMVTDSDIENKQLIK